jgi:hypothetical protein
MGETNRTRTASAAATSVKKETKKREKSPTEIVFKAMSDARTRLAAAGVDFYLVVARNGYTADDGEMTAGNAPSVMQRLDAIKDQYARQYPRE